LSRLPGPALFEHRQQHTAHQTVEGLVRPQRFHLDLQVDDVATAVGRCLKLGAGNPSSSPAATGRWY